MNNTNNLLWAARFIPLTAGGLTALEILVPDIEYSIESGFAPVDVLLTIVAVLIRVLPAAIAWRWHLIGGMLLVLFSAALLLTPVWDEEAGEGCAQCFYREWCPFVTLFLIGSVLHLIVWWRGRKKALAESNSMKKVIVAARSAQILLGSARFVPLATASLFALEVIFDIALSHGYTGGGVYYPRFDILVASISLLLVALAWRWHLIGGICLILFMAAVLAYDALTTPDLPFFFPWRYFQSDLFVCGLILFLGGVLHLLVWWSGREGENIARAQRLAL